METWRYAFNERANPLLVDEKPRFITVYWRKCGYAAQIENKLMSCRCCTCHVFGVFKAFKGDVLPNATELEEQWPYTLVKSRAVI